MGHPRWELADREMGKGIYRRRWDIQGRRIYHMTWDFQGRNGTSKAGIGLPRPELAGREETCTTAGGNWMGKELPQDVTSKVGTAR